MQAEAILLQNHGGWMVHYRYLHTDLSLQTVRLAPFASLARCPLWSNVGAGSIVYRCEGRTDFVNC